jgi:acyl-CoA synthetase (NDP forming)/acyl-coenzyme A synthetase/AMP-(fatty) acid ligase
MTSQGFFTLELPEKLNMARVCVDWWVDEGGRADDVAIYHLDDKITYRQLKKQTDTFAYALYKLGFRKGDRYLLRTPNMPEYMICFLGGQKIGAVPIPTNPMLREYELEHIVNNSEAMATIATSDLVDSIENLRSKCPTLKHIIVIGEDAKGHVSYNQMMKEKGQPPFVETHNDDPAYYLYTSGTTAGPKGVVHAHRFIIGSGDPIGKFSMGLRRGDITSGPTALTWMYALGHNFLFSFRWGTSVAIWPEPRFDAEKAFEFIQKYKLTIFVGTPTIYRHMLAVKDAEARYDLSSLRHCLSSGEPLLEHTVREWTRRFGVRMIDSMGQTEAHEFCTSQTDIPLKIGSMGKPLPGIEVAIVDDNGNICAPAEVGHLAIRWDHPALLIEYFKRPDIRKEVTLPNNWYDTKDLASMDEDGYFWYCSRSDDIITSRGYRISPAEHVPPPENPIPWRPLSRRNQEGWPTPLLGIEQRFASGFDAIAGLVCANVFGESQGRFGTESALDHILRRGLIMAEVQKALSKKSEIEVLLDKVRAEGRTKLTEFEAKQVLAKAGLSVTREKLAADESQAVACAQQIGFPVVLKVVSPDILHKSDSGGVKLNLKNAEAVREAHRQIIQAVKLAHPDAQVQGVLVQEMIGTAVETIVGIANRAPFGPVVAFGLGGVFVEVLNDVTFRLAPVDQAGAAEMLDDIRAARMLHGYRGLPVANKKELSMTMALLSKLAVDLSDEIEELDINPLVVNADRAVAVDALITLKAHTNQQRLTVRTDSGKRGGMMAVLEPRSIAVIGASTDPTKTGHVLFKNIVVNGFPGKVYPINPNATEILGHKAYPSILAVPDEIDLVFFLLPGKFVPTMFEDCRKKGVKAASIISAGFAEAGEQGAKQQEILSDLIQSTGVRCLGPNSIGFINMDQRLVASFILFDNWEDGSISLAAQSGIFAGAVADEIMHRTVQRIGIGRSVVFGNKIDLDESDFLEWAAEDKKTRIVALHLEGINNPRRFLSLANKVKREKPIIVLKPGRSSAGAKASASHTGSLAVDDTLVDHAFRQYGVTRAYDLEEFIEYMKAFQYQPLPQGNRVGVVTFSGANGVMASDELSERGFVLADFEPATHKRIKKFLPALSAGNRLTHEEGLLSVLGDKNVDAVLVILLALANADFQGIREVFANAVQQHPDKPIYVVALGGEVKERWLKEIEGLRVPVFDTTSIAIKALAAARRYATDREVVRPDPLLT